MPRFSWRTSRSAPRRRSERTQASGVRGRRGWIAPGLRSHFPPEGPAAFPAQSLRSSRPRLAPLSRPPSPRRSGCLRSPLRSGRKPSPFPRSPSAFRVLRPSIRPRDCSRQARGSLLPPPRPRLARLSTPDAEASPTTRREQRRTWNPGAGTSASPPPESRSPIQVPKMGKRRALLFPLKFAPPPHPLYSSARGPSNGSTADR